MGPGMPDMHYHSIDLFDTCIQPHLIWLCVCMRAYISYCFRHFVSKHCKIVSFLTDQKF